MLGLKHGLRSVGSELFIGSICLIGLLALAAPAAGQATQAAIIGVVADSSGAILPGVTVIATGPALQVPQVDTVTNERGEYRLSPLPIGTYSVTYELPGFQTGTAGRCAVGGWVCGDIGPGDEPRDSQ